MSSDHLWKQPCTTTFPSLSHLRTTTVPPLPYNRLFGIRHTATKRRQQAPSNPKITLESLIFIITINNLNSPPITIIKPENSLLFDPKSRFDIVRDHEKWLKFEVLDETKVTWNVVSKGYESVFTMMDSKGKGSFVSGSDGWFSVELPTAGCCCAASCGGSSGMMADMKLGMREEGKKMVVERISVGVMSILSWRYVCVDDGLRYLQHFLEPCSSSISV